MSQIIIFRVPDADAFRACIAGTGWACDDGIGRSWRSEIPPARITVMDSGFCAFTGDDPGSAPILGDDVRLLAVDDAESDAAAPDRLAACAHACCETLIDDAADAESLADALYLAETAAGEMPGLSAAVPRARWSALTRFGARRLRALERRRGRADAVMLKLIQSFALVAAGADSGSFLIAAGGDGILWGFAARLAFAGSVVAAICLYLYWHPKGD